MFTELAVFSRNERTRRDLVTAGEQAGLVVTVLAGGPQEIVRLARGSLALRAPGGLAGAAMVAGAAVSLSGPTPSWFAGLDPAITGRRWHQLTVRAARELLCEQPALIKLADAKVRSFPAWRYRSVAEFDEALARLHASADLELLGTTEWLDISSEYRMFTRAREVLACSPYLVEDEPWSPELHTHRASFHQQARDYLAGLLVRLADEAVPPAAALDVARLADGQFVILEANQSWAAGPYGCDPGPVLSSVLAANETTHPRWRWRPARGLTSP